jgi:aspartyl-tRNA synthetase
MERTYIKETVKKVGEEVTLYGWVDTIRDHGKIMFIDLRDVSGKVQCVSSGILKDLTPESVVKVVGEVNKRPENMVNKDIETGEIEVKVKEYEILSKSKELPIPIDGDGLDINEEMRLKYRYLDLRRERMRKNLFFRSKIVQQLRNFLYEKSFVEVETPILTKSTKEGSRDFIVPSRYYPGKFYALPQAPQQYKQLLMSSGIEKYFQVARCMRDEDPRADRGYEFTQLDLEMSFVEKEDVMNLVEDMVKSTVKSVGGTIKDEHFPVFTYRDAIKKYGADKFDLRTKKEKEDGILAFAWVVAFPFFKKVNEKDAVEQIDGKSGYTFTHNPFSCPVPEDIEKHKEGRDIENITTQQYDLVCNGYEVGGGSIRAHDPEVLISTFKIMGYSDKEIEGSIGHMLEAFRLGIPPHGGIALGIDRLVMILAGEKSLKEVIPFPMTSSGKTAVMDAPSEPSPEQLKELHLKSYK